MPPRNDIRGLLRNFGVNVGAVGAVKFEQRIRELTEGMPDLAEMVEPLIDAPSKLRQHFATVQRKLLAIVRDDDAVCRQLMLIPGVGQSCRWPTPRGSTFRPDSAIRKRSGRFWA